MQDLTLLINKLYQEHHLEKEEWIMLIRGQTPELSRYLFSLAREVAPPLLRAPGMDPRTH